MMQRASEKWHRVTTPKTLKSEEPISVARSQCHPAAAVGALAGGVTGYAGGAMFGMMIPSGGFAAGFTAGMSSGFLGYVLHGATHGQDLDAERAYQEQLVNAMFWSVAGGMADDFFAATWSANAPSGYVATGNYVRNTGIRQSDMTALQIWFGTGERGALRAAPRPPGYISTEGLLQYRNLIQKNPDKLVVHLRTGMIDKELATRGATTR